MNPKQDRPGARTPEDLERKYDFGGKFYDINKTIQQQNVAMEKQSQLFSSYVGTNDKSLEQLVTKYTQLLEKVSALEGNLKAMDDKVTEFDSKVTNATDNMCKAKAGFIYPLAGDKVPDGFLLCNGSSYSRTAYPELFAAIGTTWGAGNGTTTFNVPNLAERVPVGTGTGYALGATGGEATHKLTTDEMPSHSHTLGNPVGAGTGSTTGYMWSQSTQNWGKMSTASVGGSEAHNNMQPYAVCNYIIATGKTFVNTST